jgi:hypothetical protein
MSTAVGSASSILDLIYRAQAWADIAQNDSSGPATTLEIALHTSAPVTDLQSSNEVTVGQWNTYARVSVDRATDKWTSPTGVGLTKNVELLQFVEMASGAGCTITHVSVGISGNIVHYGELGSPRAVSAGIQPQFAAEALVSSVT